MKSSLTEKRKKASVTRRNLKKVCERKDFGVYRVNSISIENHAIDIFLHLTHRNEMYGEIGKHGTQARYTLHGFEYYVYKIEDGLAYNCLKEIARVSVEHQEIGVMDGAVVISPEIK